MRAWTKYYRNRLSNETAKQPRDKTFEEHTKAMGGYESDSSYDSKESFFKKHLSGVHAERYANYDKFLRGHLKENDEILSVGSGRCVNELYLLDSGYKKITCSDLGVFSAYLETKALFPEFSFTPLNVLESSTPKKFNAVISLSLIYLFDERDFDSFLRNVADSLQEGGVLILDSAGAPDNLLTFIIHDIILRAEVYLSGLFGYIKSLGKQKFGVVVHAFGYRRKDSDIISAAEKAGFQFIEKTDYGFTNEFRRSKTFRRIVKPGSSIENMFAKIGRRIPYTRMFYFRKVKEQSV